jgi:hypothetical protein
MADSARPGESGTTQGAEVSAAECAARMHALLELGPDLVDELGRHAGEQAARSVQEMERTGSVSSELLDINERLMPMLAAFKSSNTRPAWLQWFTGERLERDVVLPRLRRDVEALVQVGERAHDALQGRLKAMQAEVKRIGLELRLLEVDTRAARMIAEPAQAAQRLAAGFEDHDLQRLQRRCANLEAMAVAGQLTRKQFAVALRHGREVGDRYAEVRALLIPLWRQALGFDLFTGRALTRFDTGS